MWHPIVDILNMDYSYEDEYLEIPSFMRSEKITILDFIKSFFIGKFKINISIKIDKFN